ncbi:DUF1326 domain-containing protein [Pseudonocardia sp.]|uniref:DUF1326 domain-containing protein n=1 Tax=Pseudonocardia sp. TaxID=60912 RepID=UPI00263259CF|nr:DUF1326 domain-containing protein [Pseudonocardia sp.]
MTMGYRLHGRMAEVCTCHTYCPCSAGLEPDGGFCEFNWVFHFDEGEIDGVGVAGLNMGVIGHLDGRPGVPGTVRAAVFVDDASTTPQHDALLAAFTGQAGGPLAELAALIGEVVTVERVTFDFDVAQGTGRFRIGEVAAAEVAAHRGPDGRPTTLTDHALSGVLGRTAYPGMPTRHDMQAHHLGFDFSVNSAEQFDFAYASA